jgi:hypothetical protein
LYNENNILCCEDGIYTYNSNFDELLFFKEFEDKIISKNKGAFITFAQFPNNGYVIILSEQKFYLLSNEGEFIFEDELNFLKSGSYYSLIPFYYENNYNFVITSINDLKYLNLLYYNINIS